MKEQMNKEAIKVINTALHTKFEASSFYSSWKIFDEKFNIGLI